MHAPGTVKDTHPEIHAMLADYYQQLTDYHLAKAADPVSNIPLPDKPNLKQSPPSSRLTIKR